MPRNELSVRANPLAGSQQNSLGRKILNALIYGPSEALPMEGRYNLLPLRQTDWPLKGDTEWALPGIAAGMVNAFTAPGRAIEGKIAPSQMVPEAMNFAGNVGLDSWALSRAMQDPTRAVPNSTDVAAMVYHGSPHRFPPMKLIEMPDGTRLYQNMLERPEIISGAKVIEDFPLGRFDSSKIGTGEGAQAYGHGLYFAEAPEVAEGYARNLANRDLANQGRLNAHANAQRLANLAGDPKYAADDIRFVLSNEPNHPQKKLLQNTLMFLESGDFAKPLQTKGSLYKVDIPDEKIAQMLDWDKPMSQQPQAIQDLAAKVGPMKLTDGMPLAGGGNLKIQTSVDGAKSYWLSMNGKDFRLSEGDVRNLVGSGLEGKSIYQALATKLGSDVKASEYLKQAGIPGIRYLDAGSRGSGQGTSNYALFDDSLAKILKRE